MCGCTSPARDKWQPIGAARLREHLLSDSCWVRYGRSIEANSTTTTRAAASCSGEGTRGIAGSLAMLIRSKVPQLGNVSWFCVDRTADYSKLFSIELAQTRTRLLGGIIALVGCGWRMACAISYLVHGDTGAATGAYFPCLSGRNPS
jgi:hypothetical protein